MIKPLKRFLFGGISHNAVTVDLGLAVLRICTGLALCVVFEKFLPREGVWGPQPGFVADVASMGLPAPRTLAWIAVLTEFVGGILLVLGLFTRPAAILNAVTTGLAAFQFHKDIEQDGSTAMAFFVMTVALALTGPGRFSLDALFRWLQPRPQGGRPAL